MKKLALALAPVIALLATAPAAMAEKISLNAISNYLNGLSTVQSEFTQVNPDGTISDVQKAFMEETSIQCGFCIPGFILTATEIVNSGKEYTDDELRKLLSGHLCRCTGYQNIFRAVKKTMLRRLGKTEEAENVR